MNISPKCWAGFRLFLVLAALVFSATHPNKYGIGYAAIVATAVVNKPGYKSWTITALDADTTVNIAHGFKQTSPSGNPATGVAPDFAVIQPLVSYANAALPNWGCVADATNITLTKTAATASGGATPGTTVIAKVYAWRQASIASS